MRWVRCVIFFPLLNIIVCDPVLGDEGKMYVPAEFTAIYRDKLIRHAAVITPNQTEATFLSGIAINKLEDGIQACNWFHDHRGVPTVIITSMQLSTTHIDVLASTRDGKFHSHSPFFVIMKKISGHILCCNVHCINSLTHKW
jgi:pyridoxal/pyridoxine/pyridoxamine kinase